MSKRNVCYLVLVVFYSLQAKAQKYEDQYQQCSIQLKALGFNVDSIYFERLRERDSCLKGAIAPNFKAVSIKGEQIELSKLKGQVFILNFWFTRCQPCIEEMPELNKLVDKYSDKNVQFISFAPESSDILLPFLIEHPFKFKTVGNSENIRQDIFKLFSGWPYSIIIDKQGKINKLWWGNSGKNVSKYYTEIIDKLL